MRKFVNDPRAAMIEMLEGVADANPAVALIPEFGVIVRADVPAAPAARSVALISGGGSGHEPAHAGYVGPGMLTAAVAGDVFTSPSVDAVLAGIEAAAGPAGALLIVKNYTGDRLNFGLAAELARARGIPCEIAVVADDAALRDIVAPDRRRGIAGTVLAHKVAGAEAAAGSPLADVAAAARAAANRIATMGVALGPCAVPAAGRPGFDLGDDEMELGLGIHGEPGVRRAPRAPADAIVDAILATLTADLALRPGDRVALLVNGLGGTPPMELSIVARHALRSLRAASVQVERLWCGNFLTALEMPGCSLSLMRVDDAILARLDAPTAAPAWPGAGRIAPTRRVLAARSEPARWPAAAADPAIRAAALRVADALEASEAALTALDTVAGDGDLGLSLARGAAAARALPDAAFADSPTALAAVAGAVRHAIAGSSGLLYAAALLRAASALPASPSALDWSAALAAAARAIGELGGARPGDRTMLDALAPAAEAFARGLDGGAAPWDAWAQAVAAADAGVAATMSMRPRRGRAEYLGDRVLGHPDAGAAGVLAWMRAIAPDA